MTGVMRNTTPKLTGAALRRTLAEQFEGALVFADGLDDALIGIGEQNGRLFALYDKVGCLEIFRVRDGASYEEALEHLEVNVIGAYVGESTPAFVDILRRADEYPRP